MIILIIGVAGFLGKNIANFLTKDPSIEVIGLDVMEIDDLEFVTRENFSYTNLSFLDTSISDILENVDIVIHLARTIRPGPKLVDFKKDLTENVIGSVDLFKLCTISKVKKFIFISSGGTVYGDTLKLQRIKDSDLPSLKLDETDPCQPTGLYGLSMYTIENYLRLIQQDSDTKLVVLRLSNPFGPFQQLKRGQGLVNVLFENHFFNKKSQIWGDGTAERDYIFIKDVCLAIMQSIRYTGSHSLFNIGTSEGKSINEVIHEIENVLGEKLDIEMLTEKKVKIKRNVLNTELAKRELEWVPSYSWENGVRSTMEYYKKLKEISNI